MKGKLNAVVMDCSAQKICLWKLMNWSSKNYKIWKSRV